VLRASAAPPGKEDSLCGGGLGRVCAGCKLTRSSEASCSFRTSRSWFRCESVSSIGPRLGIGAVALAPHSCPLGGYFSRLPALFDDPVVLVFLDDLFNAWLDCRRYMTRRDSKAFRSRADLLPFLLGKSQAHAAIEAPALASKTGHLEARAKPVVLASIEVATKRLVFCDALLPRHRLLPQPGGFEGGIQIETPFQANDLAFAERPGVRLIMHIAASVAGDGGDQDIATVEQLMELMQV
jgi:hypothetical protein